MMRHNNTGPGSFPTNGSGAPSRPPSGSTGPGYSDLVRLYPSSSSSSSQGVDTRNSHPQSHGSPRGRRVLVVRHGERIDFTFNKGQDNWVARSFDQNGKYKRFNINMPRTVPHRRGSPQTYMLDTPLTEMGYLQAKLTGRALKDAGVKPTYLYVSTALRCVQTCVGILKGMNNASLKIQVEPGLFEWGGWFRPQLPAWMTPEELVASGYPINTHYKPVFPEFTTAESIEDYYHRSYNTILRILDRHPEDCTIILVAHGASLDTLTRQITGHEPRVQQDFYGILHQTPYLACASIQEFSSEKSGVEGTVWRVVEPPILPLTHQANSTYDWRILKTTQSSPGKPYTNM